MDDHFFGLISSFMCTGWKELSLITNAKSLVTWDLGACALITLLHLDLKESCVLVSSIPGLSLLHSVACSMVKGIKFNHLDSIFHWLPFVTGCVLSTHLRNERIYYTIQLLFCGQTDTDFIVSRFSNFVVELFSMFKHYVQIMLWTMDDLLKINKCRKWGLSVSCQIWQCFLNGVFNDCLKLAPHLSLPGFR